MRHELRKYNIECNKDTLYYIIGYTLNTLYYIRPQKTHTHLCKQYVRHVALQ